MLLMLQRLLNSSLALDLLSCPLDEVAESRPSLRFSLMPWPKISPNVGVALLLCPSQSRHREEAELGVAGDAEEAQRGITLLAMWLEMLPLNRASPADRAANSMATLRHAAPATECDVYSARH